MRSRQLLNQIELEARGGVGGDVGWLNGNLNGKEMQLQLGDIAPIFHGVLGEAHQPNAKWWDFGGY